jgi:hypothetical protein
VFIRSEPCGTGYAVTMRCARPSDIRSGAFYKQLAAYDQENGITVLDDRCPMAVNVLPLAKIAELRRMTGDYATSDAVPLDDFIVNGEVGIAVYAEQMPLDDARDNFRMELQYMTPAEARELARRWRQS